MAYKRRNREFEDRIAGLVRKNPTNEAIASAVCDEVAYRGAESMNALVQARRIPLAIHPTLWLLIGIVIGFVIGHALRGF